MLQNGIIEPANSPYSHNVIVVVKKDGREEGLNRFCVNLVPLNKKTIPDRYLLPNINEMLGLFHGAKYYTTLDLASAYWQVMLRKQNRYKTAFVTPYGQYQFRIMPFGLNNAPATF